MTKFHHTILQLVYHLRNLGENHSLHDHGTTSFLIGKCDNISKSSIERHHPCLNGYHSSPAITMPPYAYIYSGGPSVLQKHNWFVSQIYLTLRDYSKLNQKRKLYTKVC